MKLVKLGSAEEQVSEMCLGTMMFGRRCDKKESDRILSFALDNGINFVDTAAMYGEGETEKILGRIMKNRRKKFFLTTKVHKGIDGKSILASIDESLKRLQTDYVDLYLIHWPRERMNPEEIMETLNEVTEKGKTRFIGCSNYPAWLFAYSNCLAKLRRWKTFINHQVCYNLIERGIEVEVLPQAIAENIAITTYRSLAIGLLTGKYKPEQPIPNDSRGYNDWRISTWLERYKIGILKFFQFAKDHGLTPAQLAISWVRKSSAVTCPIIGVSSLNQLEESIKAFDFNLSDQEYKEVTDMFDTGVKEESGGDYKNLRRHLSLLK
ncbi:aldo/keto reductase [bacterium]|nr:aldo/keto reductase [bacterium]